ncbi:MAG: hypothetical protein NZ893_02760, partial [Candidatus Aenigmarchaeota archaeon]|nr:hypothetical protein [Candidatus Aenigmarchaeota archaeon]
MEKIADYIYVVINEIKSYEFSREKEAIKKFRSEIEKNNQIKKVKREVLKLCEDFPIYEEL